MKTYGVGNKDNRFNDKPVPMKGKNFKVKERRNAKKEIEEEIYGN